MNDQQQKLLEWAFKILSAFVLPIALYTMNMSTTMALQAQQISQLQEDVAEHKADIKKIEEAMVTVQLLSQELKQIKEDLRNTNQMTKEIYDHILRTRGGN